MPRKTAPNDGASPPAKLRFFTNHALVLLLISANPKILQRTLALELNLTERAVQRIVVELEQAGYLSHRKQGRANTYKLNRKLPLQDPFCKQVKLGKLLQFLQN